MKSTISRSSCLPVAIHVRKTDWVTHSSGRNPRQSVLDNSASRHGMTVPRYTWKPSYGCFVKVLFCVFNSSPILCLLEFGIRQKKMDNNSILFPLRYCNICLWGYSWFIGLDTSYIGLVTVIYSSRQVLKLISCNSTHFVMSCVCSCDISLTQTLQQNGLKHLAEKR